MAADDTAHAGQGWNSSSEKQVPWKDGDKSDGLLVVQIFGVPLVSGPLIQVLSETHHACLRLIVRTKCSSTPTYKSQKKMQKVLFCPRHHCISDGMTIHAFMVLAMQILT